MDEQRGWKGAMGRWRPSEDRHLVALVGIVFVMLSPFFALARGEAGLLAFAVGGLMLLGAAHATPDKGDN